MKKLLQFKSCLLIALLFLLLFAGNDVLGQRVASVTGDWSNTATWGGQPVPTNLDDITIISGVKVTMDVNGTCLTIVDMAGGEILGTSILTIDGNAGVAIADISGTAIISCNVDMPANALVNVTGDLTITGAIGGAATSLSKKGSGKLILAGSNLYTGATIILAGELNVQNSSAFGGGGSVTVNTGASLELEGSMMIPNSLILSGIGSGTVAGALNNKIGINLWSGPISIDAGTTSIEGDAGSLMIIGAIDLKGNQLNIDCDASSFIFIDGIISSSTTPGSITKDGFGELDMSFQAVTLNNLIINSGTFTSTNGSLDLAGNFINSGSYNHNGGSVIFNGNLPQIIGGIQPTVFNNLELANAFGVTLGNSETIEGTLTLTNGNLVLGSNNLTIGKIAGSPSVSNMIVDDGGGECRRIISAASSYLFPIGNGIGIPEYSPITMDFTSGTFSSSSYAAVKVTDAQHPDDLSITDFLSRYWSVSESGISPFECNVTAAFPLSDVNGVVTNMVTGEWIGSSPWLNFDAVSASTISATGVTVFGDFTGISASTVTPDNTIVLTSAVGTDNQTICLNAAISDITYTTTGATGATFSGLPADVSGSWSGDTVTISGVPSIFGTFPYTISLTGGYGIITTSGTITVTTNIPTILLSSASGTDSQNICINQAITNISYATTNASGATFIGLPTGVSGIWAGDIVTISGIPTEAGTFNYTITLTGGCGTITKTGSLTVTPDNTIAITSAAGTDSQAACINTAITEITYVTTDATGATFNGFPAGVSGSWIGNVVTINGTPSVAGTFNYTITLTGGCGAVTKTGTITITPNNTIALSSAAGTDSQTACINTAITKITYSTTGASGATYSGLPAGVSANWIGNVVTIDGTPSAAGTFNYTITLTGGCGTITKTGSLTVTPENTIALSSAAGTDSQAACINIAISNITYVTTGATGANFIGLPTGVSGIWAGDVVTISGIPTEAGTFNYTITLTGGCGAVTKNGTIIVTPNNTIALSSAAGTDSQTACINTAITKITYSTTGASGATYSGLPAGVSANWIGNVVTIDGTPSAAGIFNYTITLTGGCGTITKTGSLTVTPENTIALSSAAGTDSQAACINTAISNITYVTTGATGANFIGLPTGVSGIWAGDVVAISGIPTEAGTFNYTITLTGGCGAVTKTGTIIVTPNNTIALSSAAGTDSQAACINTAITKITYSTTGASGATYSGLPAGVSANWIGNVVTIDGTPSAAGTFNYTITLTGGCGTITKTGSLTVTPENTIALSSAAGTDSQAACINTAISNITYATTAATGANFIGLPTGVSGIWAGDVVAISGIPTEAGTFNYTITLTGGCGAVTKNGTITVTPNNTIALSSAAGTDSQTACINTAITKITYSTTGATGATFSGFPVGVSGSWIGNVVTIDGTPSVAGTFNYTITLTGGCGAVTKNGTITVTLNNTIALSSAAGTDSQTACINTAITKITYSTTGATGATFSGFPAGVSRSWIGNVATINGTPSVAGTFNYTITLTGGCGAVTKTGTITVTPNNTIALSSAAGTDSQTACINTTITKITYSTTGATGATFSGFPVGVSGSWIGNVVTINGTPSVAGTFNYTIMLTGGCGTVTKNGTITVEPENTIILSSLSGTENQTKCINTAITNITYFTTGATGATFSGLPAGVSGIWSSGTVMISGTPSVSGTFNYTITLTGGCGTVTRTGIITATPNNTIALSSAIGTDNQTKCINTVITDITYTTTGATGASFSGLPTGVIGSWIANVVTISGTPSISGLSSYTITLTSGCGTVTKTGSITVTPNNTVLLSSTVGTDNQTRCINMAITNITYNTTGATGATFSGLPAGVSGNWIGNVVAISGVPTEAGTFGYTIALTGGCGTITKTGSILVSPENTISLSSAAGTDTQTKCINTAITNITYTTTGATGVTFSGLPSGVSGSSSGNVLTISGVSSASGIFNYTINLTGGCGIVTKTGTITVTPNNTIALSSTVGTDAQTVCINTAITNITYITTGTTGATFSGFPVGVSGSWAGNVVTISGTPSVSGVSNYSITLTGNCGTITKTGTISVTPNNTVVLSSAAGTDNQAKCINTAIVNITYNTTGATGASFVGLPAGIGGSWVGNVVAISGTPSASGIFSYTISLTGGCGIVTKTGIITVTPNNTILLSSAIGTDNQTKCISTAIANITYTITGSSGATLSGLPAGVSGAWSLNTVTISGTPSTSGTFSYTITLTGGCGTVTKTGIITVTPDNTIVLASAAGTDNQTKCINTAIANITYNTNGATGATFGGLPTGVGGSWAGNIVTISGTPSVAGAFSYTITLTGGCGIVTKTGNIVVSPENTINLTSSAGTDNQTKCINTPILNITYSTTGATGVTIAGLPAGVNGNLAGSIVTISGTPTAAGIFNYTVTLTGGCGTVTKSGFITITPDNTIVLFSAAGTDAQTICINTAITNITYTSTGATGATYSGLPSGVVGSWSGNVVTINGVPLASGTFNYIVTLTGGCGIVTKTGTITVTPKNKIVLSSANGTNNQVRCINTPISIITYSTTGATGATITGLPAGVSGSWAGDEVAISGVPSATGTFSYSITLTGGCDIVTKTGTITVTPENTITLSSAAGTDNQTRCVNTAITNITYTTTDATGATFSGLPSGISGIWSSNTVILSGTLTSAGSYPYIITLTGGCGVVTKTGNITVTPDNTITITSATGTDSQTKCLNTAIGSITYSTTGATSATFSGLPAGVIGTWSTNTVAISGTPTVSGTFPYIITLTGGCGVVTKNGTITVNPIPVVMATPSSPAICSGGTTSVDLSSNLVGTTYAWVAAIVAPVGSIMGAVGGTGSSITQTLVNTTSLQATATYSVTPTAYTCMGSPVDVIVTVNPLPLLTSSATATVCSSAAFSYIPSSNVMSTSFSWTRAVVVGIQNVAASGTGNINEILINTTSTANTVTYIYTLTVNGCSVTKNVTVTVAPQPVCVSSTSPPPVCSETSFNYTPLSSVSGTSFSWGRPVVAGISNAAVAGTDNISETLVNTTNGNIVVPYTYVLTANGCATPVSVNATIKPRPVLSGTLTPAAICSNSVFSYAPASLVAGTTFSWSRSPVAGISNGVGFGLGNPNEILENKVSVAVPVTYVYTLQSNGCSYSQHVSVVINPNATINNPGNKEFCSGATIPVILLTGPVSGSSFIWTNNNVSIGLAANGSGDIPSFVATNSTSLPVVATVLVSTSANGCSGTPLQFSISVNPTATATTPADQNICSGANSGAITFTGTFSSITWTNNHPEIGLAASGTGNISSFTSSNIGLIPIVATITATPHFSASGYGCDGTPVIFTLTIYPASVGGSIGGSATICSGISTTTLSLSGNTGNILKWQSSTDNWATPVDIANTTSTLTATNLATTTKYRAVIQSGVCATMNSANGTITVDPVSAGGIISGGTTICSGTTSGTLTLSGYTGTILKWQSSVSPFSTWADIVNTATAYNSAVLTQTTQFRAVVQSGICASANSAATTVTVDPVTVAGSVSGGTIICSGSTSGLLTLSGQTGAVIKWQSSIAPFSLWTDIVNAATTYTSSALIQTTQFRAVVQSGTCTAGNSATTSVTVNAATVAGSVAGGAAICSGSTSGLLTLSGYTGMIVRWESSVSPFSIWTPILNTVATYTSGVLIQTTQFRAVVKSGACAAGNSTTTTVTVSSVSVGGSISGSSTICSGSTSGLLTLSGQNGSIVKWQSSVSPFSTWTDIVNASTTYTSGILTQTTQFRTVVQSGVCAVANSGVATVTVSQNPILVIHDPAPVCTGNTVNLTLAAITAGSTPVSPGLTFTYWIDNIASIPLLNPTIANADIYYIKGTTIAGCYDIQPVTVTAYSTLGTLTFDLGSNSTICKGSAPISYTARATNALSIAYSLDAISRAAGNAINAGTGKVTYVPGWTGTSYITADATGCGGNAQAIHTVTISDPPTVTLSTSANTICEGENITLTSKSTGGTTSQTFSGSSGNINVSVPESKTTWAGSNINLSGSGTIAATDIIEVALNITHANNDQLDIFLVGPDGGCMLLSNDNGGNGDGYSNTTLRTGYIPNVGTLGGVNTNPISGTWGTEGNVSTLAPQTGAYNGSGSNYGNAAVPQAILLGENINGNWQIRVFDDTKNSTGTLVNWSLSITKQIPNTLTTYFTGPGTASTIYTGTTPLTEITSITPPAGSNIYTSVTTQNGCSVTSNQVIVNVYPKPTPTIIADYCSLRPKVQLSVSGIYSSYLWNTGAKTSTLLVDIAGNYTVTVTDANGCTGNALIKVADELVTNGDFELGEAGSSTFTTDYSFRTATGSLGAGLYGIGKDARAYYTAGFRGAHDHTTGSGYYMIVDGTVSTKVVWEQTIPVTPNTDYYFSAWGLNIYRTNGAYDPDLQFSVNGTLVGSHIVLNQFTNSDNNPWMSRFWGQWNSGAAKTAVVQIRDLQTNGQQNDFGLDDISFGSLANVPFSAKVISNSPAATPICSRDTLKLTSTITGGKPTIVYSWTGPNGFTSSAANPSISNIPSNGGGNYILSVKDWYNCPGVNDTTMVVLNITPEIPNQTTTICSGSAFTISPVTAGSTIAPAGTKYTWTAPTGSGFTGGSAQAAGQTSISQVLTNTTTIPVTAVYTVTPATPTCIGATFKVTVIINPSVVANAGSAQSVCSAAPNVTLAGSKGGAATSATWSGGSGTYNPNNTSLTAVYTPSAAEITAGTVTLTLTTNDPDGAGPCSAATSSITITIRSTPVLSTALTHVKCYGASTGEIVLTVVTGGGANPTYVWKRSNGTQVATSKDLSGLVADTYTVTVTGTAPSTCTASASVTITQPAAALQATATPTGTLCAGSATGKISLSVLGGTPNYTYAWTASSGGVVPVGQINSPNLTGLLSGTYSVTVTDANACSVNTTAIVALAANTAPVITSCPVTRNFSGCNTGIITAPAFSASIANSTYVEFSNANNLGVATDNCTITSVKYKDVASISCPITVTRTWTLGDASGLTDTCQQTLTVKDVDAPVWNTIANNLNRTIECSDAAGLVTAMLLYPIATDACDADVSNIVKNAGAFVASPGCSQSGSYTNSWKVTDDCNNTSTTYIQVITITDNTAPSWITGAGSLNRTLDCSDAAGLLLALALKPVASDLCDGNVSNIVKVTGAFVSGGKCGSQGTYINTWTVKDDCGNISSIFTQEITIIDNSVPVWLTAPTALNRSVACSDAAGLATAQSLYPAAWDNCDINVSDIVKTYGAFVPSAAGCILEGTYSNTWTVIDDCGNVSTVYSQVITIENNADPSIICPVGSAYSCDSPSLQPAVTGTATMWSDCASVPVLTWSDAITPGSCAGNYTITRNWTATNICGTTATCAQIIFVQDAKAPVISCAVSGNQNKYPDPALPYVHPDNSWNASATDGCSGATVTASLTGATISGPHISLSGVSFNEGVTNVTWTATDGCGISSHCSFTVTVAFIPQISCPTAISRNNDPNVCGATLNPGFPAWVSGTNPFNYSWIMTGASIASGAGPIGTHTFNGGVTTITWTATNVAGTGTCSQAITILDNQPPVFVAPADKVYCVNDIITADYFDPTMDITPARPDYYVFAAGNTDLNLNPATFTDNCPALCTFGIRWRIDFQDGTSLPALPGTYFTGQPSVYGTDILLPGAATSGVVHHITYWVVDCSGNVSAPKSVIIHVNPRADVIKLD